MPTYVYRFIETGETIEVQQAFTDEALTEIAHPATGDVMKVKKVFTPIGVTFKGGGFYKTDSRPSGSSASSGGSAAASTPASTGGESSSSGSSASTGGTTSSGASSGGSATGGSGTGSTASA
jgi:predicted nucleic acid-binding Zn ribbon protein